MLEWQPAHGQPKPHVAREFAAGGPVHLAAGSSQVPHRVNLRFVETNTARFCPAADDSAAYADLSGTGRR
jgi:hypothetical protein